MRQKAGTDKPSADRVVKDIRRKTRKDHSAEEWIRIVLEGLRGEESIAALSLGMEKPLGLRKKGRFNERSERHLTVTGPVGNYRDSAGRLETGSSEVGCQRC